MSNTESIKSTIKELPADPGIYKMIDPTGRIIYIGKAKNIRKRVNQYFRKNYQHSTRTIKLTQNIAKIETITVDSELEAILLESNLIKQYKPKYNVIMKDDKNFVYIKITKEDFPRIQLVRKIEKDGSRYFGPKTAAHKVKETLKVLKKIFPFRHCNLNIELITEDLTSRKSRVIVTRKTLKYPCLDYFIKRCVAPCIGNTTKEEYGKIIKNIENFLAGNAAEIINNLQNRMMKLASCKKFEQAGKIRDQIRKINDILEKQKISDPHQKNNDIINYLIVQEKAYFNLFQIRDGNLIGQENFILEAKEITQENDLEVLEAFLRQYYEIATDIPGEIWIPHEIGETDELKETLTELTGQKIRIVIPKIGSKNRFMELSLKNARIFADKSRPKWYEESKENQNALEILQQTIKLKYPPNRIECYDISHLGGTSTVGSMIVFKKGIPDKSMYRKFQLRTVVNKTDDYKSLEEVLTRRLNKISVLQKNSDLQFRKSKKKDIQKEFFSLEKNGKVIGIIAKQEFSPNIGQISDLWFDKKTHEEKIGNVLLNEIIKKIKAKRVYIICQKDQNEYYQKAGFTEINKIPDELIAKNKSLIKKPDTTVLGFSKTKNQIDKSFEEIPDLIIIDGGKGQLNVATMVLEKINLQIQVISLAKRLEEIHHPTEGKIILTKDDPALKMIQRMRDEAHRFAITYNKILRKKRMFS